MFDRTCEWAYDSRDPARALTRNRPPDLQRVSVAEDLPQIIPILDLFQTPAIVAR